MTSGLDPSGGAGLWVVFGVLLAAVLVSARRTRRARTPAPPRPRRRAALVVAALVGGTLAFADCALTVDGREIVRSRAVWVVAG